MNRGSLRRRMVLGMAAYVLLLTAVVFAHGVFILESAEQLTWEALLDLELDRIRQRIAEDPGFSTATDGRLLVLRGEESTQLPALSALGPGVHDEVSLGTRETVVKVDQIDGQRVVLVLDITEFERTEWTLQLVIAGGTLAMLVLLGGVVMLSVDRLIRPLSALADQISALQPDRPETRLVGVQPNSQELAVIAQAINGYIDRNQRFIQRERRFVDSASHELRTPIAVIDGASSVALQTKDLSPSVRNQLERIQRTSRGLESLIALLLTLARDPSKLADSHDIVALHELLPEVVEDHRYLASGKELEINLASVEICRITAPHQIVQSALGNLLRNAIENSDRGEIQVNLDANGTVTIIDPGHGMSAAEIAQLYARLSRGGVDRHGDGIGIDLIARVCEHLAWKLEFDSEHGRGTITRICFNRVI